MPIWKESGKIKEEEEKRQETERMVEQVKSYCRKQELLQPGDKVVVGCSGGADSVCLLLVLLSFCREWELTLVPVHIHHNLRGAEADADEAFCKELCRRHGLSLLTMSVQVRELAAEHGWTLEEAGRNARYEVFRQVAEQYGCTKIAVAHHKNDQAETFLFHLFRGSRLRGLSGMAAKQGSIIRPLLCVTREQIEEYLGGQGEAFCTDSTNREEEYARNRIRHSILPAAGQVSARAVEHMAETADYLRRVEDWMERQTQELYRLAVCCPQDDARIDIKIDILRDAEPLLAERVVYRALCEVSGGEKDITADYVQKCMSLLEKQSGSGFDFPHGIRAERNYGRLCLFRKKEKAPPCCKERYCGEITSFPCAFPLPNGDVLTLFLEEAGGDIKKYIEKCGGIPKNTYTKWFDYDKMDNSISFRTLGKEDTIVLYADGRGKKAAEVLADRKVPREKREAMQVLVEGSRVIWIPGIRGSEAYHVTEETRRILVAAIQREG